MEKQILKGDWSLTDHGWVLEVCLQALDEYSTLVLFQCGKRLLSHYLIG